MPLPSGQYLPEGAKLDMAKRQAELLRGGVPEVMKQAALETYRNPVINTALSAMPVIGDAMLAGDVADQWQQGNYKTAAGMGALGMLPFGAAIGKTVWHGSPHIYDKFDLSKIGTGEGNQAYGHGLYLAEARPVAEEYQRTLSGPHNRIVDRDPSKVVMFDDPLGDGSTWMVGKPTGSTARGQIGYGAESHMTIDDEPLSKAVEMAKEKGFLTGVKTPAFAEVTSNGIMPIENIDEFVPRGNQIVAYDPGALYKVDLPDEHIAKMLDWDKPIGQQSKEAQAAIEATKQFLPPNAMDDLGDDLSLMYGKDVRPEQFLNTWEALTGSTGSGEKALLQQGIPGIQYLDNGSRGAGEGTRNYVVFDDQIPQILERNGTPLANALRQQAVKP